MARSSIPNQLNASLIREVRMIVQQFFRSRENMDFNERWGPKKTVVVPAPPTPVLKCARCVASRKLRPNAVKDSNDAITIFEGTALCENHL